MSNQKNTVTILHVKDTVYFEKEISSAWHKALDSVIQVALLCEEANNTLDRNDLKILKKQLKMGEVVFSMLLGIADKSWITGQKHRARLPNSYGTLYQLSQLEQNEFEAAINTGEICPSMQRKDAVALRSGNTNSKFETPKPPILLTIRIAKNNLSAAEISELDKLENALSNNRLIAVEKSAFFTKHVGSAS